VGTDGYLAAADDDSSTVAGTFSGSSKRFSIQIPSQYLTSNFKVRFYVEGFSDSGEYCYIDNIKVEVWTVGFRDEGSYAPPNTLSNWSSNGAWTSYYNSEIIGHAAGNGYMSLKTGLDLSALAGQLVIIQWQQAESGYLESADSLRYQFSGDGGSNWSPLETGIAFSDDLGSDHYFYTYSVAIPSEYVTSEFKMRFYLDGFADSGEYCYIDDIMIYGSNLVADTTAVLSINGQQVYYDTDGVPHQGSGELTADRSQVIINNGSSGYYGYGYSCFKDVTALVRAYTAAGPNGNRPGNGTYSVGGVDATRNYQLSYAGWSLIIIYTSMATQGHQLYIYDDFTFATDNSNIDFDGDGSPGGTISGFIVPEQIIGETYSAQITCFAGEGDEFITGDYIKLNGVKLWDGITCNGNSSSSPNNVWNGLSSGMSFDGIDMDTFRIRGTAIFWNLVTPRRSLICRPARITGTLSILSSHSAAKRR
jgi:hypothetical protein